MADKIRLFIQRLKDRVQIPQLSLIRDRIKVDQIIKNYSPTEKLNKIADQLKHDSLTQKVRDLMSKYEKFTGVEEIMAIQNTVIDAQEKFIGAQDRRRDLGKQLASIEARLKELHADMQNTMKGDEKYLQLCTEEHKLIIQERALRSLFSDAEREERELFATMSAAVKLGHERERAHAERNKYWYIVASIFGTVLGIAGSSINNHLKMAEFRDMMEQQMARSASVLYTIAGGESTGDVPRVDITKAMKTEFEYQEHLARNLKVMQDSIDHLVNKQTSLIENIHAQKEYLETSLRELKRVVVLASQSSAKSDAELAKALSVVHHDLDDAEHIRDKDRELPKNRIVLDSNQIITGMGIVMCVAMIVGSLMGKAS